MKTFTILLLLCITGCLGPRPIEWDNQVVPYGLDFRKYAEQGFLITPNEYNGEYESLGIVRLKIIPSVKKNNQGNPEWVRIFSVNDNRNWYIETLNAEQAIAEAYTEAVNLGADALTQFSIDVASLPNGDISVATYEISGFAIRRASSP